MATYNVNVMVEFNYEIEADSEEAAEQQGWKWEDYPMFAEVYDITVDELDGEED